MPKQKHAGKNLRPNETAILNMVFYFSFEISFTDLFRSTSRTNLTPPLHKLQTPVQTKQKYKISSEHVRT